MIGTHPELATQAGSDRYIDTLWEGIGYRTGNDPVLMDAIATGQINGASIGKVTDGGAWKFSPELLEWLESTVGPAAVKGQRLIAGGKRVSAWDNSTSWAFSYLATKPTNYLSRSQTFKQKYWERIEEMAPYMDDATRSKALHAAAEAKLDRKALDRIAQAKPLKTTPLDDLSEVDQVAKSFAIDETKALLYDLTDYVDTAAGRVTFGAFAKEWLAAQTFDASTREAVALRLRVHIEPTFGEMELRAIRPSTVQSWLRGRQDASAPSYVRVQLANLSAVLGAAVEDGLIARNPCGSRAVRAPALEQRRIVPWTAAQVLAVIDAHPEAYRAMPVVAAGAGLRQGEVFGLRVEDVDFLGRRLHVRQQVKIVGNQLVIAPPKGGKVREVPLAGPVATALAERLRLHSAGDDGLIFTSRERKPMNRNYYNHHVWKPALRAAGVEATRANGMHALRHYFASVLLDAGESVRALADYLGHADPGFTLRIYTHMMPASADRARRAVADALGEPSRVPRVSSDAI